jgi:hypothetical protein
VLESDIASPRAVLLLSKFPELNPAKVAGSHHALAGMFALAGSGTEPLNVTARAERLLAFRANQFASGARRNLAMHDGRVAISPPASPVLIAHAPSDTSFLAAIDDAMRLNHALILPYSVTVCHL